MYQKADRFIKSNGICLFLFDVKDSKKYPDRQELQLQLFSLATDLNLEFDEYFPENDLMVINQKEKGFTTFIGDASWAAINNSEVITKVVNFMNEKLPSVKFHFNVARDGFDSPNLEIAK